VHAVFALKEAGYETIMINCNPETVSTDYDTADKLYFEPLTVEDVLSIYQKEKPIGVIVQFGGQTPLNIAQELENEGVKILGTSCETIDLAEDRERFGETMEKFGIPMPERGMAGSVAEALSIAKKIGYPLIVRPSYVLGGRGMEIVHEEEMLKSYAEAAIDLSPERPILIDKFLENAIEAEADAISDGNDVFVPSIMEHIEYAGVHSGDSACVIPPVSLSKEVIDTIYDYTKKIAKILNVIGLMNIQYAVINEKVYILEANPRASRTVPLVSKVCNISMAKIATGIMLGKKLSDYNLAHKKTPHFGVKEAVFPFNMFQEVDPLLGPEMRSTGEVLGMADSYGLAFYKAQEAAKQSLPLEGAVLISVNKNDRIDVLPVAKEFFKLKFKIYATKGTQKFLEDNGIDSEVIYKLHEERPNIVDRIKNKEIQLVINTPSGTTSEYDDSYIRKNAIKYNVPYITTIAAALAAAKGIEKRRQDNTIIKSLQEYHKGIN
jgi:carbamoyl-phosphate synthase large subunit